MKGAAAKRLRLFVFELFFFLSLRVTVGLLC
jgi:hypothetical protein